MAENANGKLGKASLVLGIIAIVFTLLPLLSVWFLVISSWLVWLLAVVGLILAIIAVVKNQKNSIAGIAACVISIVLYFVVLNSDAMAERAANDVAGAIGTAMEISGAAEELSEGLDL
jgi:FtsH-binding integral membrane protein